MSKVKPVLPQDCGTWPRRLRLALDAIASVFMQAYWLARSRAEGQRSGLVRLMAERDEALWHAALLERELAVFRHRLEAMNAFKRPSTQPEDRFEVLQITRLRGWNQKKAAQRFALHFNTIGAWQRKFLGGKDVGLFFGSAPFNKIGHAARWLVHEIRRVCPHLLVGTRTIAGMIVQAGVQVSRSSVQRILRERRPERPARSKAKKRARRAAPTGILRPRKINRTWHLDLTVVRVLWHRFYVAALLDGFSRKLLVLKIYGRKPTSRMLITLVRQAASDHGTPRFLVTDDGCQFRVRFKRAVKKLDLEPLKGTCTFNGKVERFFRTFKAWSRRLLFAWAASPKRMAERMQARLDLFREWYNTRRPHQALGGWTPEQVWSESGAPVAIAFRAHEPQPRIGISKNRYRGDPHLPDLELKIDWPRAA